MTGPGLLRRLFEWGVSLLAVVVLGVVTFAYEHLGDRLAAVSLLVAGLLVCAEAYLFVLCPDPENPRGGSLGHQMTEGALLIAGTGWALGWYPWLVIVPIGYAIYFPLLFGLAPLERRANRILLGRLRSG